MCNVKDKQDLEIPLKIILKINYLYPQNNFKWLTKYLQE